MIVASGRGRPLETVALSDAIPRPIPGTDGGGAPALSEDGRELAFIRGGTLYRVPVEGGTPVAVMDAARQPAWGDRGTLFFIRRGGLWALRQGATRSDPVAPRDTSVRTRMIKVSPLPGEGYVLSENMRADRQTGTIITIDVKSGRIDSLGLTGSNPSYSPTGHLVYVDSTRAIVAVPFSARSRRVLGPPAVIIGRVRASYNGQAQYAISRGGGLIAIPDSGAPRLQVFRVNASGDARPVSNELRSYGWMRVAPDGRRALFEIADEVAGPWTLWTMEISSGILTRLASGGTLGIRPQGWTPDSRNVLHLRTAEGPGLVMSRPADGTGDERQVANFPLGVMQGSIDSAGRLMVAKSRNTISLAVLDSPEPARVLFEDASAGSSPSISPDGKFIAYSSAESGRDEVYVRAIDGTSARERVSVNGGVQPLWNRAGTAVFYRDDVAVRRAGITRSPSLAVTKRDSLFNVEGYVVGGMTWGVLPDDQTFLMLRDRTAATYPVLVLNWPRLFDRPR
jgi:hypothetical protein